MMKREVISKMNQHHMSIQLVNDIGLMHKSA